MVKGLHQDEVSSSEKKKTRAVPRAPARVSSFLREDAFGFGPVNGTSPPLPSTRLAGLPPFPGNAVVRGASVPEPPKLSETQSEEFRVQLLARCYRHAVEQTYGSKCFVLSRVPAGSPSFKMLARAADALEPFDVAPAAWCLFSVRRWYNWQKHTKKGKVAMPPLSVVFSVKKIEERLGDEDHRGTVEEIVRGGRVIFGKAHKTLVERYYAMRAALNRGLSKEKALNEFFPAGDYERLVEEAKAEASMTQNRLDADVRKGFWVW